MNAHTSEETLLLLESGERFAGKSFGALPPSAAELNEPHRSSFAGEAVFNTAMAGYHESLTDPSYTGQLIVMTYPHMGNYGCDSRWSEVSAGDRNPDVEIKAAGMVVRSLYRGSPPADRLSLHEFLKKNNICGISDVDTRALTLRLRDGGSCNGIIVRSTGEKWSEEDRQIGLDFLKTVPRMDGLNLLGRVGCEKPRGISSEAPGRALPRLAVLDCGIKANILRLMKNRFDMTVLPSSASLSNIEREKPDGLFISNGPGDPRAAEGQIRLVRALVGKLPIIGICLGHQIASLALGGSIYKLPFGHHGVNQPVSDSRTGRVFVTSQNHGFAVEEGSLPEGCVVRYRNANDRTVEGIEEREKRIFTVQFHPEAAPGPRDADKIFDEFERILSPS